MQDAAYMFDGIDDKITINNDSLLNLGMYERFSISLWTFTSSAPVLAKDQEKVVTNIKKLRNLIIQ